MKNGKPVLRKSYSVLQDDFYNAMKSAGYDVLERGERGCSKEHLNATQFKVEQELARLTDISEKQSKKQKKQLCLTRELRKSRNSRLLCSR